MGIIESLEMTQFMCHKYLTFSLGPQINFIIGMHTEQSLHTFTVTDSLGFWLA